MKIFRYNFLIIVLALVCLPMGMHRLLAQEETVAADTVSVETAPVSESTVKIPDSIVNSFLDLKDKLQEPISDEQLEEVYVALKSGVRDFSAASVYIAITELIAIAEKSEAVDTYKADLDALREYLKEIELKRANCLSCQACPPLCPPFCPPCPPCNPCSPTPCLIVGSFTVDSNGKVITQLGEEFFVTSRLICSEDFPGGQRVFEFTVVITRTFGPMIVPLVSTNDESLNARLEGVPTNRSFKIRATIPSGVEPTLRRFNFEVAPST